MVAKEIGGQLSGDELGAWRGMLRVHSAIISQLDADLVETHGLSLRSYEVLLFLEDAPHRRMRMSDLSRAALLSASGVSRLVDRLEADGYVERRRCSSDGRGYFAVLTDAGHEKLQEARPTHLQGVRRLFLCHFDRHELASLADGWERVLPGAAESREAEADA
jgi:DNA-binding MarR family transcriptional regulator